jgi:hypothetical protein
VNTIREAAAKIPVQNIIAPATTPPTADMQAPSAVNETPAIDIDTFGGASSVRHDLATANVENPVPAGLNTLGLRMRGFVRDPVAASMRELAHFVSAHAKNPREAKALDNRVEKLLHSLEGQNLTVKDRFAAVQQEFFLGVNFPSLEGVSYQAARLHWGAGLVGALGALRDPMTAIALPVVMKGAFDVGRVLTVLPHYFGDELADLVLGEKYKGRTLTSFATVDDFKKEYNRVVYSKMNNSASKDDPRTFGFHAIGHHILEGQTADIANGDADVGRDLVQSMGKPLLPLAVCLVHPGLGLLAAAATGGLAGLQLFYESHRETHRPLGQKSLMALAFESLGWTSTRDEHAIHHRPDHMTSFTTSSPSVDGWFDSSGMPSLLNLAAYVMTQDKDVRAVPYSWRRDPRVAQEILGDQVDLSLPMAIAAAKDALVVAHKSMARLLKADATAPEGRQLLEQPMASAIDAEADAGRQATMREYMQAAIASGLPVDDTTTFLSAYQAMRHRVDGVNVSQEDVLRGQEQEPLQSKFILELVAQAPPRAWPKLTQEQAMHAVGRLRQKHEPTFGTAL